MRRAEALAFARLFLSAAIKMAEPRKGPGRGRHQQGSMTFAR